MKKRFRTKLCFSDTISIILTLVTTIIIGFFLYLIEPPTSTLKVILFIVSILSLLTMGYGFLLVSISTNKTRNQKKFNWNEKESCKGDNIAILGLIIFIISFVLYNLIH